MILNCQGIPLEAIPSTKGHGGWVQSAVVLGQGIFTTGTNIGWFPLDFSFKNNALLTLFRKPVTLRRTSRSEAGSITRNSLKFIAHVGSVT